MSKHNSCTISTLQSHTEGSPSHFCKRDTAVSPSQAASDGRVVYPQFLAAVFLAVRALTALYELTLRAFTLTSLLTQCCCLSLAGSLRWTCRLSAAPCSYLDNSPCTISALQPHSVGSVLEARTCLAKPCHQGSIRLVVEACPRTAKRQSLRAARQGWAQ